MGYASIPPDLTTYTKDTDGHYTGNSTVNRAIPHGLGKLPQLVILTSAYAGDGSTVRIIEGGTIHYTDATTDNRLVVTAVDATNFYVGNASGYGVSANLNPRVYYWAAFG